MRGGSSEERERALFETIRATEGEENVIAVRAGAGDDVDDGSEVEFKKRR